VSLIGDVERVRVCFQITVDVEKREETARELAL
jgi:hypothetical protein